MLEVNTHTHTHTHTYTHTHTHTHTLKSWLKNAQNMHNYVDPCKSILSVNTMGEHGGTHNVFFFIFTTFVLFVLCSAFYQA